MSRARDPAIDVLRSAPCRVCGQLVQEVQFFSDPQLRQRAGGHPASAHPTPMHTFDCRHERIPLQPRTGGVCAIKA